MAGKSNIKGITIEIGGETSGLEKALSGVNKKAYEIQQELKEVEKGLKFDPKNTELLAQKQKLLADAIANTGEKLKILEQSQRDVDEQFKNGEISEEQYRAFQREVIKTKDQLKGLEEQLGNVNNKWKDSAKALGEFGKSTEALGNKLAPISKVAAGAFAGIVGVGIKAGMAADDLNTLSKQTGISTEQLQKFQYASDVIDVPMETLSGSMSKLTKNMSMAKDKIESATSSMSDQEMQAIKIEKAQLAYSTAVKKHGASSLQAREANLKLNQAQEATPEAMAGATGAFQKLGISITDTQGNLRDNEDVFAETIKALGGVANETERDALAMQIFGKSAQDLNPLILGGADALKELGQAAEDKGLILSQEELDTANELNDTLDLMKAETMAGLMKVGAQLAPVLVPMFKAISEAISGVIGWFQGLDSTTMATILTVLGIVAGVAPVLIFVGKLATGISALMSVVGALGPVFAILTGPIGLTIAAIAAVIAIIVLVVKNLDWFKQMASNVGAALKTIFTGAAKGIVTALSGVIIGIKNIFTSVFGFLAGIPSKMMGFGKNIIDGLINGIKAKVKAVTDAVRNIGSAITGKIKNILGIASPSKVMMEMGEYTGEGFAVGIQNMVRDTENAAKNIGAAVTGNVNQGTNSTMTMGGAMEMKIHIDGPGASAMNGDKRFLQKVEAAIINRISQENRATPNVVSIMPIG